MHALWLSSWLLLVPAARAAPGDTHRVEAGDTLWTIARAHGCDVATLRAANRDLGEVLRVGSRLTVPRCSGAKTVADAPTTTKPEPTKAEPARTRRHHVAPGETLEGLAKRYRIPVAEIMRRNKLRSTTILVGRDLDVGDLPARRPRPDAVARGSDRLPSLADDVDGSPESTAATKAAAAKRAAIEDLPPPPEEETPLAEDDDAPVAYGSRRGLGGQSIGKPNHGRLEGGVQLPKDGAYYRRHPNRSFGATHVVELTRAAIAEVRRKHPRVHKLAIGDISDADGGRLSGHRSHQSGRDIDIGLYFVRAPKSYPKRFVGADEAPLHLAATWTLVHAFYRQRGRGGGPVAIFLDYDLQKRLVEYGRKHGVEKRVLRDMFQYPNGRRSRTGFVRHEPGHHDHLHVRYGCPPRDRACR